ncbi:MAG: sulfur carrier protein ThiS [Planctomycetota bacterium]
MINVIVNGKSENVARPMSIAELVRNVDVPANYLAIEVNGEVVPREQHDSTIVRDGDAVEVVTLVGGG